MPKRNDVPGGVFAPRPSRQESKADTTTTAARAIIEAERRAKDAKTERLRALREAAEQNAPAPEPVKRKRAASAK